MGSASNSPNESWHLYFLLYPLLVGGAEKRSMSTCLVIHVCVCNGHELTIMDWVKQICEQNKTADGVRIKHLHKILVKEDPNHDVVKLAIIKVEMAVVIDVTKSLHEATYTLEGDGPLALFTTDIINRTALLLNLSQQSMDYPNVQRVINEAVDEGIRPD